MAGIVFNRPRRNMMMDIIPMINVVFLLLIFFMVSGKLLSPADELEVSIPSARVYGDELPEQNSLILKKNGKVKFNSVEYADDDNFKNALDGYDDRNGTVLIRADSGAMAYRLTEVLSILQSAGYNNLNLETEIQ